MPPGVAFSQYLHSQHNVIPMIIFIDTIILAACLRGITASDLLKPIPVLSNFQIEQLSSVPPFFFQLSSEM